MYVKINIFQCQAHHKISKYTQLIKNNGLVFKHCVSGTLLGQSVVHDLSLGLFERCKFSLEKKYPKGMHMQFSVSFEFYYSPAFHTSIQVKNPCFT